MLKLFRKFIEPTYAEMANRIVASPLYVGPWSAQGLINRHTPYRLERLYWDTLMIENMRGLLSDKDYKAALSRRNLDKPLDLG